MAALAAATLVSCATTAGPARAESPRPEPSPTSARTATGGAGASYLPTPPTPAPVKTAELPAQIEDAGAMTPALVGAWGRAVAAAKADGVTLTLTSGYRTAAEQKALWAEGLAKYGTVAEARKWVSLPWESAHVRGIAVDAGPNPAAMAWLEAHQDQFGLCRRFSNEPWHFELRRAEWATCPALLPTAATPMA